MASARILVFKIPGTWENEQSLLCHLGKHMEIWRFVPEDQPSPCAVYVAIKEELTTC